MNLFEYGLVVASDALAQFLFSPLLGATIDRLRSVRLVCLLCSALFCGGNVFYALLGAFPQGEVKIRVWMMLVARCVTCLVCTCPDPRPCAGSWWGAAPPSTRARATT